MFRFKLFFILITVAFLSCEKDRPQSEIDEDKIQEYIADNNLDATRHSSGLYFIINDQGASQKPNIYSEVKVTYSGYLTDGTRFDSGTLDYYSLSQLIAGWQIGIPLIGKGGSAKFIIPSGLGYGSRSTGSIPENSVLIFDVTLDDFR